MASEQNNEKVRQLRVEYVFTLRAILREISAVNRSPENLKVADEIERKLNELLVGGATSGPSEMAA